MLEHSLLKGRHGHGLLPMGINCRWRTDGNEARRNQSHEFTLCLRPGAKQAVNSAAGRGVADFILYLNHGTHKNNLVVSGSALSVNRRHYCLLNGNERDTSHGVGHSR